MGNEFIKELYQFIKEETAIKPAEDQMKTLGDRLGVDWNEVSFDEFKKGIDIESEHTDTVGDDIEKFAKIALDHLKERPDYYTMLLAAEDKPVESIQEGPAEAQTVDQMFPNYGKAYGVGDRKVYSKRIFPSSEQGDESDTFRAINGAENFLKDAGYLKGSMALDYPIGFIRPEKTNDGDMITKHGEERAFIITKWDRLSQEQKDELDGIIIPNPDFRNGGAAVLFFTMDNPVESVSEAREEYPFEELSAKAQEEAIEKHREMDVGYDWWDDDIDFHKEKLEEVGYDSPEIHFSGFWSQGDGASFSAKVDIRKLAENNKDIAGILQKMKPSDEEYQAAMADPVFKPRPREEVGDDSEDILTLDEIIDNLSVSVNQSGRYSHSGTMSVDVEYPGGYGDEPNNLDELERAVHEDAVDRADEIYKNLQDQYEYLQSDENIKEMILANEYEFEGELAVESDDLDDEDVIDRILAKSPRMNREELEGKNREDLVDIYKDLLEPESKEQMKLEFEAVEMDTHFGDANRPFSDNSVNVPFDKRGGAPETSGKLIIIAAGISDQRVADDIASKNKNSYVTADLEDPSKFMVMMKESFGIVDEMANNRSVAQSFIDGKTRGTGNSTSIDGNVFYSYATPIAIRKGDRVYMDSDHYSVTTSKHQSAIRQAGAEYVSHENFLNLANEERVMGDGQMHIPRNFEPGVFNPDENFDYYAWRQERSRILRRDQQRDYYQRRKQKKIDDEERYNRAMSDPVFKPMSREDQAELKSDESLEEALGPTAGKIYNLAKKFGKGAQKGGAGGVYINKDLFTSNGQVIGVRIGDQVYINPIHFSMQGDAHRSYLQRANPTAKTISPENFHKATALAVGNMGASEEGESWRTGYYDVQGVSPDSFDPNEEYDEASDFDRRWEESEEERKRIARGKGRAQREADKYQKQKTIRALLGVGKWDEKELKQRGLKHLKGMQNREYEKSKYQAAMADPVFKPMTGIQRKGVSIKDKKLLSDDGEEEIMVSQEELNKLTDMGLAKGYYWGNSAEYKDKNLPYIEEFLADFRETDESFAPIKDYAEKLFLVNHLETKESKSLLEEQFIYDVLEVDLSEDARDAIACEYVKIEEEIEAVKEFEVGKALAGAALSATLLTSPMGADALAANTQAQVAPIQAENEINLLTNYNYAEAANQFEDVWVADTFVVLNRLNNSTGKFGRSLEEVVRKMSSAMKSESPQWMKAVDGSLRNDYENKVYDKIKQIVQEVLAGERENPIGNATHFENVKEFGDPYWAKGAKVVTKIGDHTYYEGVK